MPIYEFACKKCGKNFEELLYSSDISKVTCLRCGSKNVARKLSVFGFKSGNTVRAGGHDCSCGGSCKKHSCSTCGH